MKLSRVFLNIAILTAVASAQNVRTPFPFTITISSPNAQVALGDTIKIKIVLENISDKQITVPQSVWTQNGELSYVVSVVSATGDAIPLTEYGKALHGQPTQTFVVIRDEQKPCFLQPHEKVAAEITLNRIYKFVAPGKFFIQAAKDINPDMANSDVIRSNTISLTIVQN